MAVTRLGILQNVQIILVIACQSQIHPWRLLLPIIWQQRILRWCISHGKEVGLPWSTGQICEGLWPARLNDIRWHTRKGRTRHKIISQLEKMWHPQAYIRKGTFQPKPIKSHYSGTAQKWYQEMFRTYCLRRLWSYGYPYIANIVKLTASHDGILKGQTSLELMIVETLDRSEYLDFWWYDIVLFKEDAGLGETQIGRFLGPSQKFGSLMSYWIFPASGIPVSRATVQRVTYLDTCTDSSKQRFEVYDKSIKEIFH